MRVSRDTPGGWRCGGGQRCAAAAGGRGQRQLLPLSSPARAARRARLRGGCVARQRGACGRSRGPQLLDVAPRVLHGLHLPLRRLPAHGAELLEEREERVVHVRAHGRGTAHEEVRPLVHEPLHEGLGLGRLLHEVLHVHLLPGRLAAKGQVQLAERALGLVRLELVAVQVVERPLAASEVQRVGARGALALALLEQRPHRRNARARPNHDDGRGHLRREAERRIPHEDPARVALGGVQLLHVGGAHAQVNAAVGKRRLRHADSRVHRRRVQRRRGRDGVVAGLEHGAEVDEVLEGNLRGAELAREQVREAPAALHNVGVELRAVVLVHQAVEEGALPAVRNEGRERRHRGATGDALEVEVALERRANGARGREGVLVGVVLALHDEGGVQVVPERGRDGLHDRIGVLRQDREVVRGAVPDARGGEVELHVARASAVLNVPQLAVHRHGHVHRREEEARGAVLRRGGDGRGARHVGAREGHGEGQLGHDGQVHLAAARGRAVGVELCR
mmetsp:Transcript_16870/g.57288  ORF Transcript_16870/g.57288 Transcript_16870/m.57288 type:complete len:508 (+) Transcript_16870:51-1574(+)